MERDNDGGSNEDALGIEGASARHAAGVERQLDARHSSAAFVAAAAGFGIAVLDVDVALECVLRVKVDRNRVSATSRKESYWR